MVGILEDNSTNKGLYTSLDDLANDFTAYVDSDVRAKYRNDPLEYFKEFHGFVLPPILKWVFNKIYHMARESVDTGSRANGLDIIMCAARGGGKSLFASMIEFALWYFLDADALSCGGSEDQALIVYGYVCSYIDADIKVASVVDKRTLSMTNKKGPAPTPFLRCVASSAKAVRGPHLGALRKAPGLLVLDEAAEMADGLMKQALPMTKEARPPFNLIISTFHHAFGDFQDFWDNAEARGFMKIAMDSFDVCEECTGECAKCVPEFDELYCQLVCGCYFNFDIPRDDLPKWTRFTYQERLDETRLDQKPSGCIYPELCSECKYKDGCAAIKVKMRQPGDLGKICDKCGHKVEHKARLSRGHFPVEEVRKAWRRNDKVTFEVEYMGWRPGRGIFVLDPYEVDMSICPDRDVQYKKGFGATVLGIDWGAAGTTAMTVAQYMADEYVNIISYHSLTSPSDTDCYQLVAELAKRYDILQVLPDSSHVFQNMHIQREFGLSVSPINFTTQKEAGVGAMRMKFERRQVRIPERYKATLAKDLKN